MVPKILVIGALGVSVLSTSAIASDSVGFTLRLTVAPQCTIDGRSYGSLTGERIDCDALARSLGAQSPSSSASQPVRTLETNDVEGSGVTVRRSVAF